MRVSSVISKIVFLASLRDDVYPEKEGVAALLFMACIATRNAACAGVTGFVLILIEVISGLSCCHAFSCERSAAGARHGCCETEAKPALALAELHSR